MDLASIEALWKERRGKLLPAIKEKAARIEAMAEEMLNRYRDREDEHEENRPKEAAGVFTAYRSIGFAKRLEAWEKVEKQLDERRRQLRGRVDLAEKYQVDGASSFYQSRAEDLAERILRKSSPELARTLGQVRERELQRRKEEIEQRIKKDRQRERDQGRDRGRSR
ncbi:MAG: hypothetical protein ACLQBD_10620 [Syntrophobacteraceae bacterium]